MARGRLPGTVVALGVVSLLTDLSSEMIAPLLPAFLVTIGAGGAWLGLIEGVAESTSAFLKLASGVWSDRLRRRKPLVVVGYGLASAVRPLVALARAPWHVLAIRFTDRIGKGLRTSPRDAIIAHTTPEDRRGAAYGFHRAMDHAGALVGPLVAFALVGLWGVETRTVFALAAIPAAAAMIVLVVGVRETPVAPAGAAAEAAAAAAGAALEPPTAPGRLPRTLRAYLVVVAIFTLGNSSDFFLLLRATTAGVPEEQAPLLWALLHLVRSALAAPLGRLSDTLGRRLLIIAGWAVYAAAYVGFGFASEPWHIWALFALYGLYTAATEGAEKALVTDLAPRDLRGRAFGAFHFVVGITALPASFGFGLLWQHVSPTAAFLTGAALAAASSAALLLLLRGRS